MSFFKIKIARVVVGVFVLGGLPYGCNRCTSESGKSSSTSAETVSDALVIISPHRKSIQDELVPEFEAFFEKKFEGKRKVKVDWLDQGGTSDDLRFIKSKYENNPATSGVDIFWGGGSTAFIDLDNDGLLEKLALTDDIKSAVPASIAGVTNMGKNETWIGSAASSFGIFFNKHLIEIFQKQNKDFVAPQTWSDLAAPKYIGNVSLTDPRRSGTATAMTIVILKAYGWKQGWEILTQVAANARSFTHSSSDPIKAVANGDVAVGLAIDFYAYSRIDVDGPQNLGFVLPAEKTILDPDPIAILKGAPNREIADLFINFILSDAAQKKLVLKKGEEGGPTRQYLGRMSVSKRVYDELKPKYPDLVSPFDFTSFLDVDSEAMADEKKVINDLVGSFHVDNHKDLVSAWKRATSDGKVQPDPAKIAKLAALPFEEKDVAALAAKWDDEVFRNGKINEWTSFAKKNYAGIR